MRHEEKSLEFATRTTLLQLPLTECSIAGSAQQGAGSNALFLSGLKLRHHPLHQPLYRWRNYPGFERILEEMCMEQGVGEREEGTKQGKLHSM